MSRLKITSRRKVDSLSEDHSKGSGTVWKGSSIPHVGIVGNTILAGGHVLNLNSKDGERIEFLEKQQSLA